MTGRELIDKIHQYHLEDCELVMHTGIVFRINKPGTNEFLYHRYFWIENDRYEKEKCKV